MNAEIEKSIIFVNDFLNDYFQKQTLNEQINSLKNFNFEILEKLCVFLISEISTSQRNLGSERGAINSLCTYGFQWSISY